MHRSREFSAQGTQRRARGLAARRIDEIRNGLRLSEIEPTFQESAPREFSGLRDSSAGLDAGAEQLLHDYRAAVPLELEHRLPRVRAWGRKIKRNPLIDTFAGAIAE
jgi:hypothetical protein